MLMSLCRDYESVLNQKTDVILASKDPNIELIFNPKEIQIRRNAKIGEKFRLDYQTNQITYNDAPITTIQSVFIPKFFELIQQLMTEGKMELLNG